MTRQDLADYRSIKRELNWYRQRLKEREEDLASIPSPAFTGMPGGGVSCLGSRQERRADATEEIRDFYRGKIDELERELLFIEAAVDEIDRAEYREVIRLKYFSGNSWGKIGKRMGISERTAQRLHGNALELLEKSDIKI